MASERILHQLPDPTLVIVQSGTVRYRWMGGTWVRDDSALSTKEIVLGETVELLDEIRRLRANAVTAMRGGDR